MKAINLTIGQKVNVSYSHPEVMKGKVQTTIGTVVDHFGDGVFIVLNKALKCFDEAKEAQNQSVYNHLSSRSIYTLDSFDYFDDEDNIATVSPIK